MSAFTIRLDDEKYARLKELARKRHTSVNKLFDEMTTLILAEADAETRFSLRAARGKNQSQRGLELLAKARQ